MYTRASDAARALAEVLINQADNLDSDDLATIAEAMPRVRMAARGLAEALELRGWGGGMLYGFGEPGKYERELREEQQLQEWVDAGLCELSDFDALPDPDADQPTTPVGRKVTLQVRADFIITDEVALRAEARRHMEPWSALPPELVDESIMVDPFSSLMECLLVRPDEWNAAGLYVAGFTYVGRPIENTLDDLADVTYDDAFPTSSS